MTRAPSYHPGREIARGGMGAVLDTQDEKFQRAVAMKVMLRGGSEEGRRRFLQEARVLGQLAHPNIVPVHDLGVDAQGRLFYTMKLVKGVTLRAVLDGLRAGDKEAVAKYPLGQLLTIFQKVCDAMAFAHARGVIHRDLKPDNIMVGEFGEVLVMDWGLAKILPDGTTATTLLVAEPAGAVAQTESTVPELQPAADDIATLAPREAALTGDATLDSDDGRDRDSPGQVAFRPAAPPTPLAMTDSRSATLEGSVMGTPHYMSPEQASGQISELDERSDIFSLGGILYTILTLRPPVEGAFVQVLLDKVRHGNITPPSALAALSRRESGTDGFDSDDKFASAHLPGGRVPEALSAVAMKALQVDPACRYQSVAYLQADLAAYQGGFATSAEDAGALKQLQLLILRHKLLATAVVALLLLTGGFIARVMASERRARASEQDALRNEAKARANREKDEAALARLRDTAPTFHEQALALLKESQLEAALEKIGFAVDLMAADVEFRLFQANLLQTLMRLDAAKSAYAAALRLAPTNALAQTNLAFCEHLAAQVRRGEWRGNTLTNLLATLRSQERLDEAQYLDSYLGAEQRLLVETWTARLKEAKLDPSTMKVNEGLTFGLHITKFRDDKRDIAALKGMPLRSLKISGAQALQSLDPLAGMPLEQLSVTGAAFDSIEPLRGLSLVELDLTQCRWAGDLRPLAGMPLVKLNLHLCSPVRSLDPLRGMKLRWLDIAYTSVTNLAPLKEMPLEYLDAGFARQLRDITPLAGLPLRHLYIVGTAKPDLSPLASSRDLEWVTLPRGCAGMEAVRKLPKLRGITFLTLNSPTAKGWLTPEEFWKAYDAEKKP